MALNQTIVSPLTNIEGSISSFTSPLGSALQIISSSLPSYQATGWQHKILTNLLSTNNTSQVNITGLQLTLDNNKKYIINGYLFASSVGISTGIRIAIATANTETYYVIETPSSATAVAYVFNVASSIGSTPSTTLTDYSLIEIKAIAITAASGIATFTPSVASETGAEIRIGPSVIYYREY